MNCHYSDFSLCFWLVENLPLKCQPIFSGYGTSAHDEKLQCCFGKKECKTKILAWCSSDFRMALKWKRTKKGKQTSGNRAIWLVYRTDTNARGFWLVKRTLKWKKFKLENFLEICRYFALTSYCNTTGQSNKCFLHTRVFFGGKTKIPCFDLFIHWLIEQIMNTYQNHFSRSYENRSIILIYQANFSPWRELSADVSIAVKLKRCYIFFQFNSL